MEAELKDSSRITEEAILDSLFYACDVQNSGFVPVSRLIEYLRSAIAVDSPDNNNLEFADNLDDLSLILDPDGKDVHIDIATYQAGINEWIEDIRKRSFASTDEDFLSAVSINCASPTFEVVQEHGHQQATSTPNLSSDSVEGIGGESPNKNDWDRTAEMMSTIETLQLNNKRLLEQHSIIQTQMEQTEEGNSQLNNELQTLKKQLQSLQGTAAKCKELQTENSELRQSVAETEEKMYDLNKNNLFLLKERQNLEACIEQLQSKLISVQVQLETLEDERRALNEALAIQKQVNMKLEELQNDKEDIVQESSSKTEYLSSVINELSLANEDLKTEKNKLQEAVADLNDELVRLRKGSTPDPSSPFRTPYQTSTPYKRPYSLKQELQEQLTFDTKGLPSPLIGTSMRSEDLSMSPQPAGADHSWLSTTSSDATNTSLEKYSIIASQVANEFKEKKEKALRQIEELANLEKSPEMKDRQKVLKLQLNQEVDQFAEKVNLLCLKKKNAEKRSAKLLLAIRKLKEESQLLQEERDKAYQKLGNMSLNTDHLDTRVNELQKELQSEKTKSNEMAGKLKGLEKELTAANALLTTLRDEKGSLEKTLSYKVEEKQSLEERLEEITRSHSLLDEQQCHQLVRIKELENELDRASSNLDIEKDRVAALEESLQLSVNKNSIEMQELLDMIPVYDNELINRTKMSPRSSSPRVTGRAVMSRLQQFLYKMDSIKATKDEKRDSPDGTAAADELTISFTEPSRPTSHLPSPPLSSVSSQSPEHSIQSPVSPGIERIDVTTENLLELVPERDLKSTGSQTDLTQDSLEAMTSENKRDQSPSEEPNLLSLWRRKLSPSSYTPDDNNFYLQDDDVPLTDGSLNSTHFVDGVGLHVSPPPSEKEIEKQFKTLVLAFQTDQLTLRKRMEVQARSRDIAEKNMDKELQNMADLIKDLEEKYMKTRELQHIVSSLKTQIDLLRHSAQRLCLVAQQHGSVQQESRMWSGIEVMICHAENINRRLQRVREDLDEFRKKERLNSDDSDVGESSAPQLCNGPTRIGGPYGEEDKLEGSEPETSTTEHRNSLVNFVMAIHNTSQRAKQVLTNFRRRTIDLSALSTTREEPSETPQDSRTSSIDEGKESSDERESEETEGEMPEVVSRPIPEEPRIQKRGICRRMCGALFRFIFFVLLVIFLAIASIIILNEYTPYKLQREQIPISILRFLDPVAVLVHQHRPPV